MCEQPIVWTWSKLETWNYKHEKIYAMDLELIKDRKDCKREHMRLWNWWKLEIQHLNIIILNPRFSNLDRSLNCKRERFKIFEVEPGSNCDDVIINLIIIFYIYKNIKLIKNIKLAKIIKLNINIYISNIYFHIITFTRQIRK